MGFGPIFTKVKIVYALVKMGTELGRELGRARATRRLSFEAASRSAKISQGYLHKLESGQVDNPSPHVLQRLGEVLEVPYGRLMELAGYLLPSDHPNPPPERTAVSTKAKENLPTNQELVRLLERVLEELAEINRVQHQLAGALERVSARDE